ncbi:SCN10A [Symbiodinium natans]|uniref:SCN10A protein n=1 Tax=Symbiodinium natans TaxID=878477 RepID=A0A812G971_9DINO|nr:SCN10A [Symbiodinium natans]
MSTAISRVLKGPQHPSQAKVKSQTLRLRKQLNQDGQLGSIGSASSVLLRTQRAGCFPADMRRVTHPLFDALTALVIVLNAASIGAETQYAAWDLTLPTGPSTALSAYMADMSGTVNPQELTLRIGAHRARLQAGSIGVEHGLRGLLDRVHETAHGQASWFLDPDMRLWNFFDLVLVAMSLIDFVVVRFMGAGAGGFDTVKMLKTLRIIRVFRVFRFFRQLTQLALMITDSIKSLIWALVLLAIIIYVFAIFLTANVSSWLLPFLGNPGADWQEIAAEHQDAYIRVLESAYGSLPNTIYTLVLAVLGGRSWHEVCTPLMKVGWFPVSLLLVYVAFVVLAVLNVVTGVFVDNAFRCAEKQRSLAIQKEMDRQEQFVQQIRDFFAAMDQDDSGDVTPEELAEMLKDPTLSAYFRVLGFEIDDAARFITLLDKDKDGAISVEEFLRGCLKYRGSATAVDMHQCLRLVRQTQRSLVELRSSFYGKPLSQPQSPDASVRYLLGTSAAVFAGVCWLWTCSATWQRGRERRIARPTRVFRA